VRECTLEASEVQLALSPGVRENENRGGREAKEEEA